MEAVLIDSMGDDILVVNSARVSFDKESNWNHTRDIDENGEELKWLSERDDKLLNYLAKHGHWSPFSHPQITMRETVPIFVARQRFKHMVGFAYNEVSRRYVDDDPEFFYPEQWRRRPAGSVKQGSGDGEVVWLNREIRVNRAYRTLLQQSEKLYTEMIEAGIAPEQARMVLPQSMYTSYYVTGSLYAWARAYNQRIDGHAQKEIQELAKMWGTIIQPLFKHSWKALTEA